jgi:hypothetical protein
MNEVGKPGLAELGTSFVQASSEATRRFCEQGQTIAKTMNELNTEVSQFLSHRVARNNETMARMAKCQNFPQVFATEAQWAQDATDDYLREVGKLMEVNGRIMSDLLGSVGLQTATPPSTARASMRAAE